jgi:hypothetical protein
MPVAFGENAFSRRRTALVCQWPALYVITAGLVQKTVNEVGVSQGKTTVPFHYK